MKKKLTTSKLSINKKVITNLSSIDNILGGSNTTTVLTTTTNTSTANCPLKPSQTWCNEWP